MKKTWLFRRIWHACLYLVLVTAEPAWADFSGKVIGVLDGDTVDVLVDDRPVRVRLSEIDAPEKRQAFGTRSRQALSAMVFGQIVTVQGQGLDWRGKRTVGRIVFEGRDVNRAMVAAGMAWVYPQYVKDRSLYAVEADARGAERGLWADKEPIPPWQWRSAKRVGVTP